MDRVHSKRGQVTIFIIIGVLLLVAAIFLFSAREQKTFAPQEAPALVQEVPFELAPLNSFITQCVETISKKAITELGGHAGYIDPTSTDFSPRAFQFDTTNERPTDSEALTFGTNWYIPYWHHLASPNNAPSRISFKDQVPSQDDIQNQINAYVEKNLQGCLDFSSFASQGLTVSTAGVPKASTILTANSVVVDVTLAVHVTKQNLVYDLKNFRATHDVALGKLLAFAQQLTSKITQGQSFEKVIILALSARAGLDNDLPPFSASQHGGTKKTWSEAALKPTVESIVSYTIQKVPVKGTKNYIPFEQADPTILNDPVRRGLYSYLSSLDMSGPDSDAKRYAVTFNYLPSWKSYFDVVKGDSIGPTNEVSLPGASIVQMLLSDLPTTLRTYQTPYDISVPILTQVTDSTAFNNKGYDFLFALEANVRDNEPLTSAYKSSSPIHGFDDFSLLCNENQKTSAPVTVKVTDAATGRSVPNAEVQFNSGTSCSMGVSKSDGTLTSKFPRASGDLKVSAPGYLGASVVLTSSLTKQVAKDVKLLPLIEKTIRVKKYTYDKNEGRIAAVRNAKTKPESLWELSRTQKDLLETEKVIVTFDRVAADGEAPYSALAQVSGTQRAPVQLAPGRYTVTFSTLLFESMRIPSCPDCCGEALTFSGPGGVFSGVLEAIGVEDVTIGCAVPTPMDETKLNAPFSEGVITATIDITPQMLTSPNELTLSTLVLNMRDVPDTRVVGTTLIMATASRSARERMVTDLQMYDVMQKDASNNQNVRQLLQPR
ncbi:MAG: hypothetical protein Q7R76_01155 [Candidatus Woesearchaeota archaeon]|nr:hypothetical protein [Candidatus Woesearchaeota archaeon]